MDKQTAEQLMNQLASGEIDEFIVKKEDFLLFRTFLTAREDFKHFRGVAKHGGDVLYTFIKDPRS